MIHFEIEITLKRQVETRWSSKFNAIRPLYDNIHQVLKLSNERLERLDATDLEFGFPLNVKLLKLQISESVIATKCTSFNKKCTDICGIGLFENILNINLLSLHLIKNVF